MTDVAFPVRGGLDAAIAAAMTPVFVGYNSGSKKPTIPNLDWEFVDWPFDTEFSTRDEQSRAISNHQLLVRSDAPVLAVAPDIEGGVDADRALSIAAKLDAHADTVIVVPKTDALHPGDVPSKYRVGIPNMSGVDAPFSVADYRQADSVHILGGGPASQLEYREQLPNIESVDTSALQRSAFQFGGVWTGAQFQRYTGTEGRGYSLLVLSLRKYAETWGMERERRRPAELMGSLSETKNVRDDDPFQSEAALREALPDAGDLRTLIERHVPGGEVVQRGDPYPVLIEMDTSPEAMDENDLLDLVDALREMYDVEFRRMRGGDAIFVEGPNNEWVRDLEVDADL